jgi:hypothetical protein
VISVDEHLRRLTERAYQLRLQAGCTPRNARLGAIVDAVRAQSFIRPRDPDGAPDERTDVGEGRR